jgi:hypothetical protein
MNASRCTLRRPVLPRLGPKMKHRFFGTMPARPVSTHSGKPCAAPDCPFRRPIVREEVSYETPFAESIRRAAQALREELAANAIREEDRS